MKGRQRTVISGMTGIVNKERGVHGQVGEGGKRGKENT